MRNLIWKATKVVAVLLVSGAVVSVIALKRQQAALADAQQHAGLEQPARGLSHTMMPPAVPANPQAKETVSPRVIEAPAAPTEEAAAAPRIQPPQAHRDVTPPQMPVAPLPGPQKAPPHDPLAREALSLVGQDPAADEYWAMAINDTSHPDEERKDLIEDLNEDGLSDAKNPGPEDLPLILNRIELIEELAPSAMDQVNAEAFAEAYKDLVNMLNGQPVQ